MPFSAKVRETTAKKRASTRRTCDSRYVIVHRLAPRRVRIEAHYDLKVGKHIEIDFPKLGKSSAEVLHKNGAFYECALRHPINSDVIRERYLDEKVILGDFRDRDRPSLVRLRDVHPAEEVDKFGPLVRLSIILGAATLLWGAIFAILW